LNNDGISYKCAQLYVRDGQGAGQVRTIVYSYNKKMEDGTLKTVIKLDAPFTITPNRNSKVIVRLAREDIFFVDNTYYNGSAGGFYGGFADVVYDNCSFDMVDNIYQHARLGDVNWYLTYKNCTAKYQAMLNGIGRVGNNVAFYFWSNKKNGQLCMAIRGCELDGMYCVVLATGEGSLNNMIVQDCEWNDADFAMSFSNASYTGGKNNCIDGFFMADNRYNGVDAVFQPSSLEIINGVLKTTNMSGSRNAIILDEAMGDVQPGLVGDINGDNIVDLKDATLIEQYIVGKITLTESQLFNGDVNDDGVVDLKDATLIKFYVVGKIDIFPAETL